MLRHAYETTTLSRQYQAAPFLPAEALAKADYLVLFRFQWVFWQHRYFKEQCKGKPISGTKSFGSLRFILLPVDVLISLRHVAFVMRCMDRNAYLRAAI